jgi:hypothetical protein
LTFKFSRAENFFSSNLANGELKNPFSDFKNVNFIFVKSEPKKVSHRKMVFLGQTFLGGPFAKAKCIAHF